ncbi:lymphocyte antigen 86-like [Coregonus clupeaformis]|uniref:lymphocyte antigen 86-like n=1 Tax=Coregonus clupeaformis TaxID=59861 RepID=UPI001BDFE80A|nr:lymphocyte antigen 86-like [Coregonus clupeaformis]
MPHQALLLVLAILLANWPQRGLVQEVQWPVHTICNTDKLQIFYRSCDPLQDIGISVNPCLPMSPSYKGNLRVSFLLRQSIEELYLSANLLTGRVATLSHDEPRFLPDFPRFSFCFWKKGELIDYEKPVKLKNLDYLPLFLL